MKEHNDYFNLLGIIASFSSIFSDNSVPYINYRVVENLYCKYCNAENLSRSDIAFDAKTHDGKGVGLKTFICNRDNSIEKVAEFNRSYANLSLLNTKDLINEVVRLRNERIDTACRVYGIDKADSIYHIVARKKNSLVIFETEYDYIDTNHISNIKLKANNSIVHFDSDGIEYQFNRSKSTLYRRFVIPKTFATIPVAILDDPFEILRNCPIIPRSSTSSNTLVVGKDFVILPLYSTRTREVSPKSGINQWNAGGRVRKYGEVYIPVPVLVRKRFPDFFPERFVPFSLKVPTGEVLSVSICQENGKALMSNPNTALSDWLLKTLLDAEAGKVIKYKDLADIGYDSVIIYKDSESMYRIDKAPLGSYETYMQND